MWARGLSSLIEGKTLRKGGFKTGVENVKCQQHDEDQSMTMDKSCMVSG